MSAPGSASLKQTVTDLFDAVHHSSRAEELDGEASRAERDLVEELNKLESQVGEVTNLLGTVRAGADESVAEFSQRVEEFLETAKEVATEKLQRTTTEEVKELREAAASERDKALKSLESYFASDPLPVVDRSVQVKLAEGIYEAKSSVQCEGGIRYDFRLATRSSRIFSKASHLSRLGVDPRIPVRFSRTTLRKDYVPGFERLGTYLLATAETSGEKVRASFEKQGGGARIKVVTSGSDADGFVGIEYTDQASQVNVMINPALSAHVDLDAVKKAMGKLAASLSDLSSKKVAMLKLSISGEEVLGRLDCEDVLKVVLKVMGPAYQSAVRKINGGTLDDPELTIDFIRERLKVLGGSTPAAALALGFQITR